DLRPAGHAGLDVLSKHIAAPVFTETFNKFRPLRPRTDQAHLAQQHVEQLRQLIQTGAAQKAAQWRNAFIIRLGPRAGALATITKHLGFRINVLHRAKLEDLESLAVQTHALLTEDHRTRTAYAD